MRSSGAVAWVCLALLGACTTGSKDAGDTDTANTDAVDTDVVDTDVVDTDVIDTDVGGDTNTDVDGDGVTNPDDPNPQGSAKNLLDGVATDGAALVVKQAAYDSGGTDTGEIYEHTLAPRCDQSWTVGGTLCDERPTTHDLDVSSKSNDSSGATFYNSHGHTTGVLVIDACSDGSCTAIDFSSAAVFQMNQDGRTTSLRIAIHPDRGATHPAWDDDGWNVVTSGFDGFVSIGEVVEDTAGGAFGYLYRDTGYLAGDTDDTGSDTASSVEMDQTTDPTFLNFLQTNVTRYVRVEMRNDGSQGEESYVELRALKLFGAPPVVR